MPRTTASLDRSASGAPVVALLAALHLAACGGDEGHGAPHVDRDAAPDGTSTEAGAQEAAIQVVDASGLHDVALDHVVLVPEASSLDAGAGAGDAGSAPLLSNTGLYAPGPGEVLAAGVREFRPRFELWADGAEKRRFLLLPPGQQIDTTDMDAWRFPVGTKVWKEFAAGGVRVETRLLEKIADGPGGWTYLAYAWNAAQTSAVGVPLGVANALGTSHDIPDQSACVACHSGSPDFLLGVSALQLARDASDPDAGADQAKVTTLADLLADGLLTAPPPATTFALPGDARARRALGVLHANCGHCHRPGTFVWERAKMDLHLPVSSLGSVPATPAYTTAVGVATDRILGAADSGVLADLRIAPHEPQRSAVYVRMASRAPGLGMPSIATEQVDPSGSLAVFDWILSL